ncbi:MAG: hypothetical protein V8S24_11660 [Gordonibacter pamelaeae]
MSNPLYNATIPAAEGETIGAGDPLTKGSINPQYVAQGEGRSGRALQKKFNPHNRTGRRSNQRQARRSLSSERSAGFVLANQGDTNMLPAILPIYSRRNPQRTSKWWRFLNCKANFLIHQSGFGNESSSRLHLQRSKVFGGRNQQAEIRSSALKINVIIGKLIPAGTGT